MKKYLSLLLSLIFLASCAVPEGEGPSPAGETESPLSAEPPAAADAVARAVIASQPEPEGYQAREGEDLGFYLGLYGLEEVPFKDAAVYTADGVDGREVAVLLPESMNNDFSAVTAALEEYRRDRAADFFGYAPQQAELVEQGAVLGGWGCVALLLCGDMKAAQAAFEAAAGSPGEEASFPGFSPEESRWFAAFDPPNEVDMTLYDTTAIRTAWEMGDRSALSETDAAILSAAEEALALLKEGMSGYEKELLLHDWLLDRCSYDATAHDPRTPEGREHSRDPYGPMVEGYGICLGYAASFQLLMDLAGVECITVVGASKESRQDHAWNMVRLEGEWYCVDVTWDDSGNPQREEARHTFFNCTSELMRDTNHQWDYQNVPKATAARFAWAGEGQIPS